MPITQGDMEVLMASTDVYRVTDQLDEVTLAALVTRLEARGKHEDYFVAMKVR